MAARVQLNPEYYLLLRRRMVSFAWDLLYVL
jgi:hypothetical protein